MNTIHKPLVSVIMPALNAEKYIEESLKSLINQSYKSIEIIVVNDNSTDRTVDIVSDFIKSDKRIRLLTNPKKGVSSARNHGIMAARGDFICFLDSDDIYHKEAIHKRADYLINNPGVGAVFCEIRLTGPNLNDLGWIMKGKPVVTFEDFHGNPIHTASVMFRTNIIKAVGFDETYTNGEDWLCWQRIARMGIDYHRVMGTYILYRQHHATVLSNFKEHEDKLLKVLDIVFGEDINCLNPKPQYRNGLNVNDKNLTILHRRIRLFFFLCVKGKFDDATEVGKELLSYNLKQIDINEYIASLRIATVRAELCHMDEWKDVLNKKKKEIEPYLFKYLPQEIVIIILSQVKEKNMIQMFKTYVKSILIKHPALFNIINPIYIKYILLKFQLKKLFAARKTENKKEIVYLPGFSEQSDFVDQYYRILWYLNPIINNIKFIYIPVNGGTKVLIPDQIPDHFDPEISKLQQKFKTKIKFLPSTNQKTFIDIINKADIFMEWDTTYNGYDNKIDVAIKKKKKQIRTWRIDNKNVRYEGSFYLKASSEDPVFYESDLQHSKDIFLKLYNDLTRKSYKKAYVFGTGPSLKLALDSSIVFDDGLTIACNSMLKNTALMKKLNPRIIVASDPIFHAGCSSYAGEFRQLLIRAIDEYDAYFITSFRDFRTYLENLPNNYRSRIIGVPYSNATNPNLNLINKFHLKAYSNVLMFFLIPIAATFTKNIYLIGNDGRRWEKNAYFWEHDKASQLNDKMDVIQNVHPSFFNIDYDDYYKGHLSSLEEMIQFGEKSGYSFFNLTPSFIPVLQQRTIESDLMSSEMWKDFMKERES